MPVSKASIEDIAELVPLINSAYRGEASKKGWTTEADLLVGAMRTDVTMLTELMSNTNATVLKFTNEENKIIGSVYLDIQDRGLYLGMLTVSPLLQAGGIGKQLMYASEAFAKDNKCACIFMNVISIRHELVAWYERLGYNKTGETKPLPTDNRFGVPTQPIEFVIMEKKMN
ncbi:MAG: GNAT family N-acetyltransferase [Chitinophagaceae bacterium]|nr:GNAT family N-acetyltransferase [Chitinophagaceae bacterium]